MSELAFADGTVLDLTNMMNLLGTEGGESIYWDATQLNINAGDGHDSVYTGNYDDIIAGGKGNDTLDGGGGNDTYIFNSGDGLDLLFDTQGSNSFVFTDLEKDDFGFLIQGGLLNVSYGDGDNIMLAGNVSRFELADGSYLTDSDVNYIIQQISAFSANNGVNFSTADDVRRNEQMAQLIAAAWNNP